MARRGVLGMAACAAAIGMVFPGGGVAHAAEVCEFRSVTVPSVNGVQVDVGLCVVTETREVYVLASATAADNYVSVEVRKYADGSGEPVREIVVCSSLGLTQECVTVP